jgi:hypothetical protein
MVGAGGIVRGRGTKADGQRRGAPQGAAQAERLRIVEVVVLIFVVVRLALLARGLGPGQTVRLTAMLEAVAPETGSILVDVDVRGAPIFLDGVDTGRTTNTILDNVSVGTHELEIRAEGMDAFRETVLVRRGERVEIHRTLTPAGPTGGRLTIVISPAAAAAVATVMVDGDVLPSGSRSRSDIEPGSHVVQVSANPPFRWYTSTDGGKSYHPVDQSGLDGMQRVSVAGPGVYLAHDDAAVFRSADGLHWTRTVIRPS